MTPSSTKDKIQEIGKEVKRIQQDGIPFNVPLGIPISNPAASKRIVFKMRYKIPGISLEEARQGIMFADYSSFVDIKKETYSRKNRTRYIQFNPFTKEMERMGGKAGSLGKRAGHNLASFIVAKLGLIEWEMSEDAGSGTDVVSINIVVTNRLFAGHFKVRAIRQPEGVILEDDWTPDCGAEVRTKCLAMANLVLSTHPRWFDLITAHIVEEVEHARIRGAPYIGEIGPPSVEIE